MFAIRSAGRLFFINQAVGLGFEHKFVPFGTTLSAACRLA